MWAHENGMGFARVFDKLLANSGEICKTQRKRKIVHRQCLFRFWAFNLFPAPCGPEKAGSASFFYTAEGGAERRVRGRRRALEVFGRELEMCLANGAALHVEHTYCAVCYRLRIFFGFGVKLSAQLLL